MSRSQSEQRAARLDPFGAFKQETERILKASAKDVDIASTVEEPPDTKFGQLSSSISFELAKTRKMKPMALAEEIAKASAAMLTSGGLVKEVEAAPPGYVNFKVDFQKLSELTLRGILEEDASFGFPKTSRPERIIVEHTSANPARPIHIGTAKNALFGDALARLLSARGHNARAHFYIDDTGRQVALMAYGYRLLEEPRPVGKPDQFVGAIYSCTATLVEIEQLKKKVQVLKDTKGSDIEVIAAMKELDDWVGIAAELQAKYKDVFDYLADQITKDRDPDGAVGEIVRRYEKGDPEIKHLIRSVAQLVLVGFEQTLSRAYIRFDSWDWESDLIWSGRVREVLDRLKETKYVRNKAGAWELDVPKAVDDYGLREKLGLSKTFELSSLTLTRSDGTTLYTTRDIAYSLYKFEKAERVISVIGTAQSLAQLQLRVALWILGHRKEASNNLHFLIGEVELEGQRMSARRGRYVTFDTVLEEAVIRARKEVDKRSPDLPEDLKQDVAERIGISAIRYTMLSVEPAKGVNFVWDRVLNFEMNSAPFINYAYTRGLGIIRKLGKIEKPKMFDKLNEPAEQALILQLSKLPEVFAEAADDLNPTRLCTYTTELAQRFHEFYEKSDISHLTDEELKWQRVSLVIAVRDILRKLTDVLGLRLAERM